MCGRYAIFAPPHRLKDLFGTENILNLPPRYNAAPLQDLPVIIRGRMGMARWGLLPPFAAADDKSLCAKMINARSETVAEKPSFRDSWDRRRRCLIPANGFYEWKGEGFSKKAYWIMDPVHDVICFAGLWSKLDNLVTFTILTKDAVGDVAGLHHRSPVILNPEQAASWFESDEKGAMQTIKAARSDHLRFHEVGAAVGKVANDDETLIKAAGNGSLL